MQDDGDGSGPRLRVDRLARAVESAWARERGQATETPDQDNRDAPGTREPEAAPGHGQEQDANQTAGAPDPDTEAGIQDTDKFGRLVLDPSALLHPGDVQAASPAGAATGVPGTRVQADISATAPPSTLTPAASLPGDPENGPNVVPAPPAGGLFRSRAGSPPDPSAAPRHAASPVRRGPTLLGFYHVKAAIDGVPVLRDVAFEVPKGAVSLLVGPDGAGKSAVLRAAVGLADVTAGRIGLSGDDIGRWSPEDVARSGIGYVPRNSGVFNGLSVAENIALGSTRGRVSLDRIAWVLRVFPALKAVWTQPGVRLTAEQRKMVAIARVLGAAHRLYLLDRPSEALAPPAVAALIGVLRDLKVQGATILIADDCAELAGKLADTVVVLEAGRSLWSGEMSDLSTANTEWSGYVQGQTP